MRQSSLGVIQRVEARYRLAVGVRRGTLECGEVGYGSRGKIRLAQVGQVPFRYGSPDKALRGGVRWGLVL